jgi:hypothetical protein
VAATHLLVISSCTGAKAVKSPALAFADFSDPDRLAQRESELAVVRRPAAAMYTGWQHLYLMRGVKALQRAFGDAFVDLRILSAGYGLIGADRMICPYDLTFNDMSRAQAHAWAMRIRVPGDVRAAVADADLVVLLLGSRYLDAIDPPLAARPGQRVAFFAKPSESSRLASSGVVTVPAGKAEAAKFGSGLVALKGKMFERFAETLANRPDLFHEVMSDDSPATFLSALGR